MLTLTSNAVDADNSKFITASGGHSGATAALGLLPAQPRAAIKSGKLLATASFDAMKMACLAAEAAVRYLNGESVPREILLPVEIVDRANCVAWDLPFEARALPEWDAIAEKI